MGGRRWWDFLMTGRVLATTVTWGCCGSLGLPRICGCRKHGPRPKLLHLHLRSNTPSTPAGSGGGGTIVNLEVKGPSYFGPLDFVHHIRGSGRVTSTHPGSCWILEICKLKKIKFKKICESPKNITKNEKYGTNKEIKNMWKIFWWDGNFVTSRAFLSKISLSRFILWEISRSSGIWGVLSLNVLSSEQPTLHLFCSWIWCLQCYVSYSSTTSWTRWLFDWGLKMLPVTPQL